MADSKPKRDEPTPKLVPVAPKPSGETYADGYRDGLMRAAMMIRAYPLDVTGWPGTPMRDQRERFASYLEREAGK